MSRTRKLAITMTSIVATLSVVMLTAAIIAIGPFSQNIDALVVVGASTPPSSPPNVSPSPAEPAPASSLERIYVPIAIGAIPESPATSTATSTTTGTSSPGPTATPMSTSGSPTTPTSTATSTSTTVATATVTPTPTSTGMSESTLTPTSTPTGPGADWWQPTNQKPIHWHWQLSQEFVYPRDVISGVTVYDIDGELTSAETVAQLHALGEDIIVICYFDAGVFETYRSDASEFPGSEAHGFVYSGDPQFADRNVIGDVDVGWDGSFWLDIRQLDVLRPIMEARIMNWCKDKGFDAIEPDETEVWSNASGFEITKAENNAYNKMIAELAHKHGLSVGLKGNTTEAAELEPYFDWTLNEECWQYNECANMEAFLSKGKAVFNIEYRQQPDCAWSNTNRMNSARRDLNLQGPTHRNYRFEPCTPVGQDGW